MKLVHFYSSSGFHVGTWKFACVLELENTSVAGHFDIWVERLKIHNVEGHCNICYNYFLFKNLSFCYFLWCTSWRTHASLMPTVRICQLTSDFDIESIITCCTKIFKRIFHHFYCPENLPWVLHFCFDTWDFKYISIK